MARICNKRLIDWSKVPIGTDILVSSDEKNWYKAHFAKYEDGIPYSFYAGESTWVGEERSVMMIWRFVRLAEHEVKEEYYETDD